MKSSNRRSRFRLLEYLCDGRIVYRPTRTEIGYHEYHRWATSPRRMISDSIAQRIDGAFSGVQSAQSIAGANYRLTGSIDRLDEVDGKEVQAVVELSATLVDARTQSVVWRDSEVTTEPVMTRGVPGVVSSLSVATRRAIDALIASLDASIARGSGRMVN